MSANKSTRFFHLHLVSDATGETLHAVAKAAAVQYAEYSAIEHIHSLVRNQSRMDRVLAEITETPGMVLFTLVNDELRHLLERHCLEMQIPCLSVLDPVLAMLASFLNATSKPQIGGQHVLDAEYFGRIEALNFTMLHDDGQHAHDIDLADVILVGISRTSKTPTSIYLANRGIKTANVPLVPDLPLPEKLTSAEGPLVVGLVATPERVAQIRRNRLLSLKEDHETDYINKTVIAAELNFARRLCQKHGWPLIDVTRRSIEETAAAVLNLYHKSKHAGYSGDGR